MVEECPLQLFEAGPSVVEDVRAGAEDDVAAADSSRQCGVDHAAQHLDVKTEMVDLARHVVHKRFCIKRNAKQTAESALGAGRWNPRSFTASRSTALLERRCRTRLPEAGKRTARGSSFVCRGRAERDRFNPPALGYGTWRLFLAVLVNVGRAAKVGADGARPAVPTLPAGSLIRHDPSASTSAAPSFRQLSRRRMDGSIQAEGWSLARFGRGDHAVCERSNIRGA